MNAVEMIACPPLRRDDDDDDDDDEPPKRLYERRSKPNQPNKPTSVQLELPRLWCMPVRLSFPPASPSADPLGCRLRSSNWLLVLKGSGVELGKDGHVPYGDVDGVDAPDAVHKQVDPEFAKGFLGPLAAFLLLFLLLLHRGLLWR